MPWQTFEEMLQTARASARARRRRLPPARAPPRRPRRGARPVLDGSAERVPVPLPAVRLAGPPRRLAGAPALAAGTARSADHGDVEQLGRDQRAHGRASWGSPTATSWRWPPRTGSLRAPVVISPGIGPDAVAMPVGQGHETFTRYASGRGANPLAILAPMAEAGHRAAGLGGHAREGHQGGRGRWQPDSVCRRHARAARPHQRTRLNGASLGHGRGSGQVHGLRGLCHRLPRRKQHSHRRRRSRRRAAAPCTGCGSSATGRASSPT